jgi:hypothetical protein
VCAPSGARADGTITYAARWQVTGVVLPRHDYAVTGSCATGTGLAPASLYASGGSGGGFGFGAGIGGRIGYAYASPPSQRGTSFWGFRAGAGLDLDILFAKVATGIADMTGKLCARVKSDGAEVDYKGSSLLLTQIPFFLGGELGLGHPSDGGGWHGVVLGAAWAPSVTYLKPWVTDGNLSASYLGTELTVDFVDAHGGTSRDVSQRVALFLLFPVIDHAPAVITVSFGAVWH